MHQNAIWVRLCSYDNPWLPMINMSASNQCPGPRQWSKLDWTKQSHKRLTMKLGISLGMLSIVRDDAVHRGPRILNVVKVSPIVAALFDYRPISFRYRLLNIGRPAARVGDLVLCWVGKMDKLETKFSRK